MTQSPVERRFVRIAGAANQKAIKVGALGRISSVDLFEAYTKSEGVCTYCPTEIDPLFCSFDHVIPFDKGGLNRPDNIVACCMSCQRTKFTKSPEQLEQWQRLYLTCPIDQVVFRPRWADWTRGLGRYCSRRCAGTAGGLA